MIHMILAIMRVAYVFIPALEIPEVGELMLASFPKNTGFNRVQIADSWYGVLFMHCMIDNNVS